MVATIAENWKTCRRRHRMVPMFALAMSAGDARRNLRHALARPAARGQANRMGGKVGHDPLFLYENKKRIGLVCMSGRVGQRNLYQGVAAPLVSWNGDASAVTGGGGRGRGRSAT